eukprot:scaffold16496_cov69-Attheya_sp.AAC.1
MVKVWCVLSDGLYQPPPYGPRTSLNRPAYGISGDAHNPAWVTKISKMPRTQASEGGRWRINEFNGSACLYATFSCSSMDDPSADTHDAHHIE